ncbi:Alpha-1,4 glucan phosphorylase L isozyme [Hibiscus syriacus]|uniref:Alpha-1,4 glucan phosphorylase n=1 Tax=Hibiscus syriacus TaxID=106335 RepID=A0A6A3BRY3_HIBSY|nr:Alpha-1,4 glucan phosphorylase L isozyme [Hibiscus syriacus]
MASLPFSATSFHSTFIGFNYKAKNPNFFLIRKGSNFTFYRINFFVKSVSSDQKQDLKDEAQVTGEASLDTFAPASASMNCFLDMLMQELLFEAIESTEEDDVSDEETEPTAEEDQLEEEEDMEEINEVRLPPIIEPNPILPKMFRMANLCVAGGYAVNGVAEIHSEILWPEKFQNKTNGVAPRRWIRFCNPDLSKIITKWTGSEDWVLRTDENRPQFADNKDLQSEWREAKRRNKVKVASFLREKTGYSVNPDSMFDVQIKRIHEYKRQLLNIIGIVYRYKKMKEMSHEERKASCVPRVCIFGGKAFATCVQAKRIVKFITDVGNTVNHDPEIGDLLKVCVLFLITMQVWPKCLFPVVSCLSIYGTFGFFPLLITARMEASGTSNMKFAMNGCILIGTLVGANVEIRQEVGEDNFFLFGTRLTKSPG